MQSLNLKMIFDFITHFSDLSQWNVQNIRKTNRTSNGFKLCWKLFLTACISPILSPNVLSIKLKYLGFLTTFWFALFHFTFYIIFAKAEFFHVRNFEETLCLQLRQYASIRFTYTKMQITLHSADFGGDKNVAFDFPDACRFGHPIYFDYQDF